MTAPATVEQAVKQRLEADSQLMAILTGGVWTTRQPLENMASVRDDAGRGQLKPLAVIVPGPPIIEDQFQADVMGVLARTFSVYLYQPGPGYEVVSVAVTHVERVLQAGRLPNTSNYTCQSPMKMPDEPAAIEQSLQFASLVVSRWQVVTRRIS